MSLAVYLKVFTHLIEENEATLQPLCFHFEIFHQVVLGEQAPELNRE
jgi:hypothetical protein